ncbi:HAD family hydrolase [[Eubacterium] hominis]|uniref:HAD family hydrolase n=1 Tax=[Eubacterium] hominis TaxID=2764325 RepID=UPI003A4E4D50
MKIETIIWDWNGTLLDDIDISMEALNRLLKKQQLPQVLDKEEYRKYFQFPVMEYYKKVGFDFDQTPFSELAKDYMAYYQPHSLSCHLHLDVKTTLERLKHREVRQYLLSASDLTFLNEQLAQYDISTYFSDIKGLDNIHAHSKAQLAKDFVEDARLNKDTTIFVGDSVHDSEVATYAGCHCLLIGDGHEHIEKLQNTGCPTVETMKQAQQWLMQFC